MGELAGAFSEVTAFAHCSAELCLIALVNHLREFDLSTTDAEWAPKWTELLAAIRAHTGPLTKDSVDNVVKQIQKQKEPLKKAVKTEQDDAQHGAAGWTRSRH